MKNPALVISQYYRPELIGSAPYMADIAEWLARERPVTVVAGLPHYPEAEAFAAYRQAAPRAERINGVVVERLRSWIPQRRSAIARIASELLFMLHGLLALASRRIRRQALVVSLCPSIFTVLLGTIACRGGGVHVAIVHDIQSGLAGGLGLVRNALVQRAMQALERFALNRTDLVVVLTEAMKHELRALHVTTTIEVMPLWVEPGFAAPAAKAAGGPLQLLYNGNMGRKQALDQIIALAEILQQRRPEIGIVMRGAGGERDALEQRAVALGLGNIRFADLLPPDRFAEGLAEGDIHLVPQNPAASSFAVPSKIYNIMAAARPFIATASAGSPLWRLKERSGAFVTVPPNDVEAFAAAVIELADDPALRARLGARGRNFVESRCAKPVVLDLLVAMIEQFAAEKAAPGRRGVLLLEPQILGHQPEWLDHLIRFALTRPDRRITWFAVGAELYQEFCGLLDSVEGDRVRVLPVRQWERALFTHRNLTVGAFARWWILCRYLKKTGAGRAHVLEIDHFALPFALGLGAAGRRVSGILFRPSTHYRFLGAYRPGRGEVLRDLRKNLFYRLMLRNPAIERILSLDPFFPRHAERVYAEGWKVAAIDDPAHPVVTPRKEDRLLAEELPRGRMAFVLFGYLTERKGLFPLLQALAELPPEIAAQIAVLFAGRVDPEIHEALAAGLRQIGEKQADLWLKLANRRLGAGELEALVERADLVLAPYQRFVGSSGVLYWAARAEKPILTQDFGLIGALVRAHDLGLAVDTADPHALAKAITHAVTAGPSGLFDAGSARRFVATHTEREFSAAVFASLSEDATSIATETALRPDRSVAS